MGENVTDRSGGGDVTFHGPGQLVGYPIIDLKRHRQDLHWYLRSVEEVLIRTIGEYGIPGERPMGAIATLEGRRKNGEQFPVDVSISKLDIDGEGVTWFAVDTRNETRTRLRGPCSAASAAFDAPVRRPQRRGRLKVHMT